MSIQELHTLFLTCSHVSTDTRTVKGGELFFALKGENFNGNVYALQALEAGAKFAVVDENIDAANERLIYVENVLDTLQQLAAYHRSQFSIPVIGITGTNGKTTTKELLAAVLSKQYNCCVTKGNFNNHIGVPLTLLSLTNTHEVAIIEMGANHAGEIAELCEIAKPNYGLITSIGKAHLEGFGNIATIIETKTALFRFVEKVSGTIFLNKECAPLTSFHYNCTIVEYGNNTTYSVTPYSKNDKVGVLFSYDHEQYNIYSQLIGDYNAQNILAAITVGITLQLPIKDIITGIENYTPQNNRSQIVKKESNTYILDAYNANPTSMYVAIKSFLATKSKHKVVLLGDMLELGSHTKDEHQFITDYLVKEAHNCIIYLVGTHFSQTTNHQFPTFEHVKDAGEYLKNHPLDHATIFIKGSRGIGLEKILQWV